MDSRLKNEIAYEIDKLAGRLSVIPISKILDRMGFPANYKALLDIE